MSLYPSGDNIFNYTPCKVIKTITSYVVANRIRFDLIEANTLQLINIAGRIL